MSRDTLQGWWDDRPDHQRMLDQVRFLHKQGRHVVVVAAALDRTGRDLAEPFGVRKSLRQLGVRRHYRIASRSAPQRRVRAGRAPPARVATRLWFLASARLPVVGLGRRVFAT